MARSASLSANCDFVFMSDDDLTTMIKHPDYTFRADNKSDSHDCCAREAWTVTEVPDTPVAWAWRQSP